MNRLPMVALTLLAALAGAASAQAPAQSSPPAPPAMSQAPAGHSKAAHDAMARLAFLVGKWSGTAVIQPGPGAKRELLQDETVESRLDGLVLVTETASKLSAKPDVSAYHGLGVFSYDVAAQRYQVTAFLDSGESMSGTGRFRDDGDFEWGFTVPGQSIRFVIRPQEGDWLQTGERSSDGGKTWTQYLDVHLKRSS